MRGDQHLHPVRAASPSGRDGLAQVQVRECRSIKGLFQSLPALPAPVPQAQVSFVEWLSQAFVPERGVKYQPKHSDSSGHTPKGGATMSGVQIGQVTHYFDHINVSVLSLNESIKVGDTIHILGHATDFKQEVTSLQIEHKEVNEAKAGDNVAMKVIQRVHPNDKVFKITEED
jgi:hypothetical protein